MKDINEELIAFVNASPSKFHAVNEIQRMLEGYEELQEDQSWSLKKGRGYFVKRNDSSIIAFRIPAQELDTIRVAAAHSDSPTFKLKCEPEMTLDDKYLRLNTELYGAAICYSWLDRALSVAGRVAVMAQDEGEAQDKVKTILVNIDEDLLVIPSVAIHMNRDINDGYRFNLKSDTIPLAGAVASKGHLLELLARNAGVETEAILGYDLYLYPRESAKAVGIDGEYIVGHALDDLQCAYAITRALKDAPESSKTLQMVCIFDNEEVGSLTGQGADSTFLQDVLWRVNNALGYDDEHLRMVISRGYSVSADNAHAVHPNHPEYSDSNNRSYINDGIVIKFNAAQKYTTDAVTEAVFRDACRRADVPVQTYTNRSDMKGGSTLGNISMAHVSIRTVDVGLPLLAMHSCYETAGACDTKYLYRALKVFFE